MKEKKRIIENDMETKRKTRIPNLPEIFEKKLISFFQELPDGDMSKPIDVLFKSFKKSENDIADKIEKENGKNDDDRKSDQIGDENNGD